MIFGINSLSYLCILLCSVHLTGSQDSALESTQSGTVRTHLSHSVRARAFIRPGSCFTLLCRTMANFQVVDSRWMRMLSIGDNRSETEEKNPFEVPS